MTERLVASAKFQRSAALAYAITSNFAFACSGAGASRAMAIADVVGVASWAGTLLLAIVVLRWSRLRSQGTPAKWLLAVAVFLHPGLWLSSAIGDCGRMRMMLSVATTITAILLAGWLVHRAKQEGPSRPAADQ